MAIQSLHGPDQSIAEYTDAHDNRREHLINALHTLKSNISSIEQRHPYLHSDLSSTCDKAILSLQGKATATETINSPSLTARTNPVSLALDKTGTHIINGLDKMGDGIIFLFLKARKIVH